ncbi:MAG: hypothetical protein H0T76_20265 [Nannocystis sp.]|nr:hypothetical protein [Nannocystis sp.]MBA3548824.1 hypothetical protein [Nannocystis sp.]
MNIADVIQQQIDAWGHVGHPALMERFVQRNGRAFQPAPYRGRRKTPKMCFKNAIDLAHALPDSLYAEGYGWWEGLPLLVPHAWVVVDDAVVDPTWERPEERQYFGVTFEPTEVSREIVRNGRYSVLDPGMINLDFMFACDPGLRAFLPTQPLKANR